MKNYFILSLLLFSVSSQADTISSWTVYLNGLKLKTFTEVGHNNLSLKLSHLKTADDLAIQYSDDTPCSDCTYEIILNDEFKNTIITKKFKRQSEKVHLNLSEVIEDYKASRNPKFYLVFFKEFYKGKLINGGMRLFTLTIN